MCSASQDRLCDEERKVQAVQAVLYRSLAAPQKRQQERHKRRGRGGGGGGGWGEVKEANLECWGPPQTRQW